MRGVNQELTSNPIVITTLTPFEHVSGGSEAEERIGNQINARGHLLSGILRNKSDKTMIVRIIKLYNRRVVSSDVDSTSDIFLSLNEPASATNIQFKSMYAPFNREQYKIVSDRRYTLGDSSDNGRNTRILKDYTKLNHLVKYSNNVGSNINWGNLQICFLCYPADGVAGVIDNVDIDFESTCYYTE